jgi:mono/diheme cytochrome c family protein
MERQRQHITGPIGFSVTLITLIAGSLFVAAAIQQPPARAYSQADAGAELYQANCAACHQAGGEGIAGTFPPLAGNPAATDAEYVASVIGNGLSGPWRSSAKHMTAPCLRSVRCRAPTLTQSRRS